MKDYSFIQFFLNDFDLPKLVEDRPISTLTYRGFVVQKPNETFTQITNSSVNIVFVGGISVELIDCGGNVQKNITSQFYYSSFTDRNGIKQIKYEFGNINQDFYSLPLYIKITDLTNGNIYYSTSLLVTDIYNRLSTLAYYWSNDELNGRAYHIAQVKKSIRFVDCYIDDISDKEDKKEYTQYQGNIVSYRSIITDLDVYKVSNIDNFTYRRLQRMFQSQFVYLNNQRVVLSEIKKSERKFDTNWFNCEFTVNPQNENLLILPYQIYQGLTLVTFNPSGVYSPQIPASTVGIYGDSYSIVYN